MQGHDRKRAQSIRDTLGGSPLALRPSQNATAYSKSFNLVVCGFTDYQHDGFGFTDFLAYCTLLGKKNVGGTFLSCFDVDKYFGHLSVNNINDIKFGLLKNGQHILSFDRFQLTKRKPFWEDVKPADLKARVLKEIARMASEATPGDVVNIILEGHGNTAGEIKLGQHFLNSWDFARALDDFVSGVQVNAINNACHSGIFVDTIKAQNTHHRYIASACKLDETSVAVPRSASNRCRGSRYEQAWVQSFAKIDVHGTPFPEDEAPKTVQEHEQYIIDNIHRNFSKKLDTGKTQEPQYWVYSDEALATAVEDMIFRDKIDVLYDPQITSRRRRIEWPSMNPDMIKILSKAKAPIQSVPDDVKEEAIKLLDEEVSRCDADGGVRCDMAIFDYWPPHNKNHNLSRIGDVLTTLYYRARLQSAFLDTFSMLVDRGFVCPHSLAKPVRMHNTTPATVAVAMLLSTFEYVVKEMEYGNSMEGRPHKLWEDSFLEEPIDWLATMIVRGCADIEQLFETIKASKFLGNVDETALQAYKRAPLKLIACDPNERACLSMPTPDFGFWLPHGLGNVSDEEMDLQIYSSVQRFNKIERVFKKFFQVPDYLLLAEEQQGQYMDTHGAEFGGQLGIYLRMKSDYRRASSHTTASTGTDVHS